MLVLATAVLVVLAGLVWFELEMALTGIALAVGLLVFGTATLASCWPRYCRASRRSPQWG